MLAGFKAQLHTSAEPKNIASDRNVGSRHPDRLIREMAPQFNNTYGTELATELVGVTLPVRGSRESTVPHKVTQYYQKAPIFI